MRKKTKNPSGVKKDKVAKRTKAMKKTKKTAKINHWRISMMIGAAILGTITTVLAIAVMISNSQQNKSGGFDNLTTAIEFDTAQISSKETTKCSFTKSKSFSGSLSNKLGSKVIDFHNARLISDYIRPGSDYRNSHKIDVSGISAGNYKIRLQSFDGYPGRESSDPKGQKKEQYYVKFLNHGKEVARTGVTDDLKDKVRRDTKQTTVNDSLKIPKGVDEIVVQHRVPMGNKYPNSLTAVCMQLEPNLIIIPRVDGKCGSANSDGKIYQTAPTKDLCERGTAKDMTSVVKNGKLEWSWKCYGLEGGSRENCTAKGPALVCATSTSQTGAKYNQTSFIVKPSKAVTTITEGEALAIDGATNIASPAGWRWIDAKKGTDSYKGKACTGKDAIDYPEHPYLTIKKSGSLVIPRNDETEHHLCLNVLKDKSTWTTPACTAHKVVKINPKPVDPTCGDGKVNQEDEKCDAGQAENGKVCVAGYGKTCTYCDANCKEKTVVGPKCGDGHTNGEEKCDNGDNNGKVPTVGYGETKDYCKSDCTNGTVVGGQCGNGTAEGDEQCDLGTDNNGKICTAGYGQTCEYCDSTCQHKTVVGPKCGDGVKNGEEKCDKGDDNGKVPTVGYGKTKNYCKSDCTNGTVVGGQCGNGTVEGDEQCDDSNTDNGDGCSATCQTEQDPEPTPEPDCNSSIGNYIWYDTNANGIQEDIEEGIEGIEVCAYRGDDSWCDVTDKHGRYKINNLCEGKYKIKVKGVGAMVQTYDPDSRVDSKTKVTLGNNDNHTKADFGYRGKAPSTGLATNIALLIGLSTLLTIGILLILRRKGAL